MRIVWHEPPNFPNRRPAARRAVLFTRVGRSDNAPDPNEVGDHVLGCRLAERRRRVLGEAAVIPLAEPLGVEPLRCLAMSGQGVSVVG